MLIFFRSHTREWASRDRWEKARNIAPNRSVVLRFDIHDKYHFKVEYYEYYTLSKKESFRDYLSADTFVEEIYASVLTATPPPPRGRVLKIRRKAVA